MIETIKTELKDLGLKDADIKELTNTAREYDTAKYKGIDKIKKDTFLLSETKLDKEENKSLNKKQSELTNKLESSTNEKAPAEVKKGIQNQDLNKNKEIKAPVNDAPKSPQ